MRGEKREKLSTRSPHVAGQFYELDPEMLRKQITASFLHRLGPGALPMEGGKRLPRDIVGCISPHAGYMFSGMTAAHVFYALSKQNRPKSIIVMGPDHTGMGGPFSSTSEDWATPFGPVKIDMDSLVRSGIPVDDHAHRFEHSIEVQLPFLQYIWEDLDFLPVMISGVSGYENWGFEEKLASLDDPLIIASSDFTHYESAMSAKEKDSQAIEAILDLDEKRFIDLITHFNASICGYAPIVSAIITAKRLGATKAELLKYTNSGDITGDYSSVVAYAAIVFRK